MRTIKTLAEDAGSLDCRILEDLRAHPHAIQLDRATRLKAGVGSINRHLKKLLAAGQLVKIKSKYRLPSHGGPDDK